jgi:hypothetical protein
MGRRRPGGNFGNFGAGSFSKQPTPEVSRVKPILSEFGGSAPDSLYSSNRESSWTRWRKGWELAVADGARKSFNYPFTYAIPFPPGIITPIGGRQPVLSGVFQGFPTQNKELGMHWAGKVEAGNLRFDNLRSEDGQRLAISGEVDPTVMFLGSGQDNTNFWYVQVSGTYSANRVSGVTGPLPPPLFVSFGPAGSLKAINGDVLQDTILTVSGEAIDADTINPATGKRYGFVQAVLIDVDQNQGILKFAKTGSVEVTIDSGVRRTPSRIPFHEGRFLESGPRYCCSCQDYTRRDYAYLSTLGLRKKPLFPYTKCATVKPGRTEIMSMNGQIMNAAQTQVNEQIIQNRLMTIVYPSGEEDRYDLPGVGTTQSGKDLRDPKTLYRDFPAVFADFGRTLTRSAGDNEDPIADGMPTFNDYKQSGEDITFIGDNWTFVLDQYRYCKHIYAMRFLENEFPTEPSDFPVEVGLMSEWENKLVLRTQAEQSRAFKKLDYYGLGYMDVPPFNCQSPMMMPMMQRLFNVPSTFIQMQYFKMIDKDGNSYAIASGQSPNASGQNDNFSINDWNFKKGINY